MNITASMTLKLIPESLRSQPVFLSQKNVIALCDSWYAKKDLVCVVDEYANLDIICNARYDSVIYDPAPQPTGKKGLPSMGTAFVLIMILLCPMKRLGMVHAGFLQIFLVRGKSMLMWRHQKR